MGNDRLSSKQVGSQASRRVTRRLAWIQPVCICINAVPSLKGLREMNNVSGKTKGIQGDMNFFSHRVIIHIWHPKAVLSTIIMIFLHLAT